MCALRGSVEHDPPTEYELQVIQEIMYEVDKSNAFPADVSGPLRVLRYLRGRVGVKAEAMELFKEMLDWRTYESRFRVDDLRASVAGLHLEEYQDYFAKKPERRYLPGAFLGRSRDGALVAFYKAGLWDADGLCRDLGENSLMRHEVEKMEWIMWFLHNLYEQEGKVPYLLVILDLEGANSRQLQGKQRQLLLEVAKNLSRHYCDAVELTVVINAPLLFRAVWALISPFMTNRQKAKLRLFGNIGEERNLATLHATVSPELLPAELGGRALPDIWGDQAQRHMKHENGCKLVTKTNSTGFASWMPQCCMWRTKEITDVPSPDINRCVEPSAHVSHATFSIRSKKSEHLLLIILVVVIIIYLLLRFERQAANVFD